MVVVVVVIGMSDVVDNRRFDYHFNNNNKLNSSTNKENYNLT